MESPAKKRSIFGLSSFFRSSTAPPAESDAASKSTTTSLAADSPRLSRGESGNASAPESPVKRATDTQLASRKLFTQPRGPSSKLQHSINASDFERPSSVDNFVPRRKPGDNPYKTAAPSAAHFARASVSYQRPTNFSGASTTPRNMFRTSHSLYSRPGLPSFSPHVPANTLTQSFPPNTPGRPPRGSVADVSSRGLGNTTSTELFEMSIPEPPRHLTGDYLTKELRDRPKDTSRSGSVYADEYLSDLCPPDLDEHQRRQFFCILDLRRLKYSADEVFTKKDWKINVLNFAKEFEKNRSLIMLRYGLYEFKTVRASEAVKKEWKQKHGIPDSESESEATPAVKANSGSKRKAEEDLKPADTALTASSSNANKRARAPEPAPTKTKRKADSEPDENQPAKLLKPAATPQKTPSATKSVFESIANKATSTTPAKPPTKNLFGTAAPKLTNGNGGSVFDSTLKPVPAANIFGHLSDTSKGSPNDDADAESETDSGEAEGESEEVQEASPSDEPSAAASGDVPTPQFGGKTPATLNGTSSASSEAGESTQGRSLFDRITRGSDGQPVRHLPAQEGRSPFALSPDKERSASPAKDLPSTAPANNTWNANTPIKFSAPSSSLFASTASKPAAIDFGASTTKKPEAAAEPATQPPTQNLFGGLQKKADEPAKADATPKAASLFSGFTPKPAASAATTSNMFGSAAPASTNTGMFGTTGSVFGQQKPKEESKPAASTPAASLFGSTPAAPADGTAKPNVFQSSTLFGKAEPATQTQASTLFGKAPSTEAPAAPPTPSLFASKPAETKSLFAAASPASTSESQEPAAKKISFGHDASKPAPTPSFSFGSSSATDSAKPAVADGKPLFGAMSNAPSAPETKSLFEASSTTSSAPATKSLFGASSITSQEQKPLFGHAAAAQAVPAKPLFGAAPTGQTEAAKPIFGSAAPAAAPASSGSMFNFGGSQTPAASQPTTQPAGSGSIFGTGGGASFNFSAGGGDTSFNNPFASGGTSSAPTSFNFGSGGGNDPAQPGSASFTFGASATPSFNFGGGSDSTSQAPAQSNTFNAGTPTFSFGGASSQPNGTSMFSQPPSTTSMFGNSLAPGGGTSTGTNSPFTFGGASSLATTPATGTPEPSAPEESRGTNADGDEAPQEQISLTEGGPGEEDESVVHEIRAKAVKLVTGGDSEDDDSGSTKDKKKSPWVTQGIGPLRLLKHKNTGAVRMLLRAEPRGHVALNKLVLPNFIYKVEPAGSKYVKLTTATDDGKGLETWMLQVKTPDAAKQLAESLEANKKANAKK
ncbi:nucleoporin nup61 [Podospora aff. communis PSN243]|uniref:Nucleoporin nup61 n=1 Tax=Podospora aff. communis PSN243 TaxID=3040156 RepID=A0AAV9GLQ8_9PEZI|nr:nucleoporin nup61 [Podospora aff. communis PSN243]